MHPANCGLNCLEITFRKTVFFGGNVVVSVLEISIHVSKWGGVSEQSQLIKASVNFKKITLLYIQFY